MDSPDLRVQRTEDRGQRMGANDRGLKSEDRVSLIASLFPFCEDKSVGCGTYLKNASQYYIKKYIADGIYHSKHEKVRMILGWGIVLVLLYWLVYSVQRTDDRRLRTEGIGFIYKYTSPLLLTSILFTFTTGCGIFTTGSGQGDPPWIALAGGINSNTPSVRDDGIVVSGGGGGIPFTVPVTGMYFVHSDHLGSVSFLTNGRGAIIAGGEFGGKSDIQYKPYGEIDRPHSSGPDISKYKYTGQEEDKESGLLYYKARYYDPGLGRFLQADEEVFPENSQGVNRYSYVNADPVNYTDRSGRNPELTFLYALGQYLSKVEKEGSQQYAALALYYLYTQQLKKSSGPGCPMEGNLGVFGNYQGAGKCGHEKMPSKIMQGMVFFLLANPENPEIAVFLYMTNKPRSALTIVDYSGIDHDDTHDWGTSKKTLHSNERWIKTSWKRMFSINSHREQYRREFDALPKKYDRLGGTGKSILAGINYLGTVTVDLIVIRVGTVLFGVQNMIGYTERGIKSLKKNIRLNNTKFF